MATLFKDDDPYTLLAAPPALIFGDDPARRRRIGDISQRRGMRVVASDAVAASERRLAEQATTGLLVIDVVDDGGLPLDRLLAQVLHFANCTPAPTLVIATAAMIDVVAGRLLDAGVPLLVDPSDREIELTLEALLVASRSVVFSDGISDASSRRLAQLSEEVGRIARALASLSANDVAAATAIDLPAAPRHRDAAADLALLRSIIRMRRLREQFLDPALFADPAWDMLLDLAAAEIERRSVAVSSLCIAASVPATTALRWIATMTEHELLVRRPDPEDGRRVFIALGERASAAMSAYLAAAAQVMKPAR